MNIRNGMKIILKEDLVMTPFKKDTKMEIIEVNKNNVRVKCGYHMGVFSMEEIEKYFDEYNLTSGYDDISKCIINDNVTVIILKSGCKGIAKCLPQDKYEEEIGVRVAYIKAKIKEMQKELKTY